MKPGDKVTDHQGRRGVVETVEKLKREGVWVCVRMGDSVRVYRERELKTVNS